MGARLPALVVAALLLAVASPSLAAAPSDPSAASQQPLTIMRIGEALDHIGPQLVDVPVLAGDTGLDLQHPDIAPRLFSLPQGVPAPDPDNTGNPGVVNAGAAGWDLIGTNDPAPLNPDSDPSDSAPDGGHGTLVNGLLGAAWNNGVGGAGVAPNARLIALRTCWGGDQCYQYVQASAFNWAADRGARVVSMSYLEDSVPANQEQDFADAITSHPNVLFVTIPSGNGGAYDVEDPVAQQNNTGFVYPPWPCSLNSPNVLCVTTSSPSDEPECGAFGAHVVDIAVPTDNSTTTVRGGGFTGTGCATSFAAPSAAGLATILFGIDPTATAADVRSAIVDSARKVAGFNGKTVSGGIADAVAAVDLFQSRRGIPGRTPPAAGGGEPAPGGGTPEPPNPPEPAGDHTAPVLSVLIAPHAFRAGGRGLRLARRVKRGALLTVGLSEPASVRIAIMRSGSKRVAGAITRKLKQGRTKIAFAAKDRRGRRLRAGRYKLAAVATDAAGNVSLPVGGSFRIRAG